MAQLESIADTFTMALCRAYYLQRIFHLYQSKDARSCVGLELHITHMFNLSAVDLLLTDTNIHGQMLVPLSLRGCCQFLA